MDQKSHACFEVGQFFPTSKSGSRFIRFIKLYFAIKQSPLRKNVDVTITLKLCPCSLCYPEWKCDYFYIHLFAMLYYESIDKFKKF